MYRVTVDVDDHRDGWIERAIRAYHALEGPADWIRVAVSGSGRGIHVKAMVPSDRVGDVDQLKRLLGDDPTRTRLDEQRARHGGITGTTWTPTAQFGDVYMALDYIRETTTTARESARAAAQRRETHVV